MSRSSEAFARLVPWIRSQFPQVGSLRSGQRRIYLDNAAGTLVPQAVADAMGDAALWANPQPGRQWPGSFETKREHVKARELVADFLNAGPADRLFFSESTTAALYKLREGLEPMLEAGHNVVVTDCDHFANISPWEWRARWGVRRARMLADGHLDLEHFASLLDDDTRVAAVTVASNGLGTLLQVEEAIRLVREHAPNALVVLDSVHGAPHVPLDVQALGADALAFSTYKLFGPNCGILWLRDTLAPQLSPFCVEPHTDLETLMEWGTLNNVTVAGVSAALEYLLRISERLEPGFVGQLTSYPRRRRQFKLVMTAAREYEQDLAVRLLTEIRDIPGVTVHGLTDPNRVSERVPTFAFETESVSDELLEARLWALAGVQVAVGSHYSSAVLRGLGRASLARASFAHYNSTDDVDTFLHALRALPNS
jgi:cysteine desulfurase family protein (TIGR01976 family)